MVGFGFQNLPTWHDDLRRYLEEFNLEKLLKYPILGSENAEFPWSTLEKDDFFSSVNTGIIFSGQHKSNTFAEKIVTNDPQVAINRIKAGLYNPSYSTGLNILCRLHEKSYSECVYLPE